LAPRDKTPKLFVNANPGAALQDEHRVFCRTWPNQTEVTVSGLHFVQEDSPNEIGRAIVNWLLKYQRVIEWPLKGPWPALASRPSCTFQDNPK